MSNKIFGWDTKRNSQIKSVSTVPSSRVSPPPSATSRVKGVTRESPKPPTKGGR